MADPHRGESGVAVAIGPGEGMELVDRTMKLEEYPYCCLVLHIAIAPHALPNWSCIVSVRERRKSTR